MWLRVVVLTLAVVGASACRAIGPGSSAPTTQSITSPSPSDAAPRPETERGPALPSPTPAVPPPSPPLTSCAAGRSAISDGLPQLPSGALGVAVIRRGKDLWLVAMDDPANEVRITSCPLAEYAGSLSRNGNVEVYFASQIPTDRMDRATVYRAVLGGGKADPLVEFDCGSPVCLSGSRSSVAVAPDGVRVAIASAGSILLHDLRTKTTVNVAQAGPSVGLHGGLKASRPNWSADGRYLGFGQGIEVDDLYAYDTVTGTRTKIANQTALHWSRSGASVCSGGPTNGRDGQVFTLPSNDSRLFPTPDGNSPQGGYYYGCAWAKDGRVALGFTEASDGLGRRGTSVIQLFDRQLRPIGEWGGETSPIVWAADDRSLIAARYEVADPRYSGLRISGYVLLQPGGTVMPLALRAGDEILDVLPPP